MEVLSDVSPHQERSSQDIIPPPPPSRIYVTPGMIPVQNTTGGTLGTLHVQVPCTEVTSVSVIVVQVERDNNSVAGVEYIVNLALNGRVAGVGFYVDVHRATTSASASLVNNEGCTLNYIVVG